MKKHKPEFVLMILRDDDTEYALEHVSNYFQSGVPAQGIVSRDGNTVGVFERTWSGHLKIFSRDIVYNFWNSRKFRLESVKPWGRNVAYSDFEKLLEKLFQASLNFPFEFLHKRSGRWLPVSEHEVAEVIRSESSVLEHKTEWRQVVKETLEKGDSLTFRGVMYQRRVSGVIDTYDVTYPGQEPHKNLNREKLLSNFPELRTLFDHFGIKVLRELKFETPNGTIRVEGHNWRHLSEK
jgi:hypothetical protein